MGGGIEIHAVSHTCFGNVTYFFSAFSAETKVCGLFSGNVKGANSVCSLYLKNNKMNSR